MSSAEAEAQAALADAQLVASEIERLQAANQRLMAENWQLRQLRQKLETAPSDPSSSLKAEQRRSTVTGIQSEWTLHGWLASVPLHEAVAAALAPLIDDL